MLNGKYIFLDIGSSETKIVEADIRAKGVTLLKTAEMRDTKAYIDNNGIIHNIELYCLSLKKTLKEAGIKTTNVVVCSSIFGIKTQDITDTFNGSVKECVAGFDKKYGRTTNYSVVNDWQHLGDHFQEKTVTQKLYMSSGNISLLTSFVETMQAAAGLTVVSIESSTTALCNLEMLFPHSFDMPSLAVVDLGSDCIHFKVFRENAFVASVDLKYPKGNIYTALSENFNVVLSKMTNIAYNVGLEDNDRTEASLAAATITPSKYFSFVREFLDNTLNDINEQIVYLKSAKSLDDVQVVFTGGVLALPGVADYVTDNFKEHPRRALIIDTQFNSKRVKIFNKLNHKMSPKFNTCLGMMLKNFNVHSTNLIPTEFTLVDSAKLVNEALRVPQGLLIALVLIIVACNIGPLVGQITLHDVSATLATETESVDALRAKDAQLGSYVRNLTSINNSLASLTEFIGDCESNNLKIASVDTASILNVVVVDNNSEEKSADNIFDGLIVRGYATSSDEITGFYAKLKDFSSVSSVGMHGVKEVALSDTDTIYIFEMEVSVRD